ncbi:MAG: hypothetical protein Q4A70_01285 [Candidatus Saccharibacteria bacterium]|nr:hypothetical protein [Candidatus Saccharibacteria bacterium]
MDNKEIYKKTLTFSLRRFGWDLLSVVVIIILAAAGFFLAEKFADNGLIGLAIGVVIAIILVAIASHFVSYIFKAGQIAMMTKGVTEGKLPDDVYAEGKKIVKERFLTVAAYYAATSAIRGIFNQLGRAITALGSAIGGDNGSAIGSAISSVIQTIVRYLCDCCLGWVFYMKDKSAVKATLEGAVLFFKHGKTFFKNMGRMFGMSFVSFLVIGGVFFGITYLITMAFPDAFNSVAAEFAKEGTEDTAFLADPNNVMLITAAIGGIIMWSILHSVFVRPFILVGVLRNFIESGKNETISEKDLDELDGKSAKFKKLHEEAKA